MKENGFALQRVAEHNGVAVGYRRRTVGRKLFVSELLAGVCMDQAVMNKLSGNARIESIIFSRAIGIRSGSAAGIFVLPNQRFIADEFRGGGRCAAGRARVRQRIKSPNCIIQQTHNSIPPTCKVL